LFVWLRRALLLVAEVGVLLPHLLRKIGLITIECAAQLLVARAEDPERALMQFLTSTYEAAASLGKWDRAALECPIGVPGKPRGTAPAGIGATRRRDNWANAPVLQLIVFTVCATYLLVSGIIWNPVFGTPYEFDGYLSPLFSPLIVWPDMPRWLSPGLLILWIPIGFRATCYYYRKAYYRFYFADPPGCAVGEPTIHRKFALENAFPFILQNIHRYFLYLAFIPLTFLWLDIIPAFYARHYGSLGDPGLPFYSPPGFTDLAALLVSEGGRNVMGEAYAFERATPGGVFEIGPFRVTPYEMTHIGVPALGYRIEANGKVLAYITRNAGKFQVATLDLATRQTQIITDSEKDESPSFAPNGRMILLATVSGGRGVLAAVSADGRIKQRLTITAGDVREPAWGPFAR